MTASPAPARRPVPAPGLAVALILLASPAFVRAQSMPDLPGMDMPEMAAPNPAPAPARTAQPTPTSAAGRDDMAGMRGMDGMGGMDGAAMTGALGAYPMTREASGTSWQPDSSEHDGVDARLGGWSLMGHALIDGVWDSQGGPRGGEAGFASGMIMGMARRDLPGGDAVQLRVMLSPEPLMGPRGYPLLLASGESADGRTPLIDRQHPHDLFMELSASYSLRLSAKDSLFLYAGLPGEPAFGPPAFMHRASIMDSPEAPIAHHWLDSTHVVFGVVTAGWVHGPVKLEVSGFRGREPDQNRWDIETPRLDSVAARLSWNPVRTLALQASWARAQDVEQLDPGVAQTKWSASAIWTVPLGPQRWWSSTAAWGRRSSAHGDLDAYVLESALKPAAAWTLFGRVERVETDELASGAAAPAYGVAKLSIGAIHDWPVAAHLKFGLGALHAWNLLPSPLQAAYGGQPDGVMAFMRLRID